MLAEWFTALLAWLSWLVGRRTKRASEIGAGQTVVIVGGGFGGVTLAHYLESSTAFDVVLYEKRDYFEYTPSMLRVAVDPHHMSVSHLPFEAVALGRVRLLQQEVTQIAEGAVRGRGGEWTKYDKLVLAMGSDYPDHLKPEPCCHTLSARKAHLRHLHAQLVGASKVTVFGGGLVGVELAAEICDYFPDLALTFRQRETVLLPGFPSKAQNYARRFFERHEAHPTLIFENDIPPAKYKPEQGEVVFNCTGVRAVPLPTPAPREPESKEQQEQHALEHAQVERRRNHHSSNGNGRNNSDGDDSSAAASAFSVSSLVGLRPLDPLPVHARTGLLRVTPSLHLVGHPEDVYALGDVMVEDGLLEVPMSRAPKVAYQAELQAWCVAENLKRVAEGRGHASEWSYPQGPAGGPSTPTLVCCSLGPRDGIVIFNGMVFPGWISVVTKFMLERTKMNQLRGGIVGEIFWTVIEPISLFMHRRYVSIAQRFAKKESEGTTKQ